MGSLLPGQTVISGIRVGPAVAFYGEDRVPAPLPVLRVLSEPPHKEVGLHSLGPKDVVPGTQDIMNTTKLVKALTDKIKILWIVFSITNGSCLCSLDSSEPDISFWKPSKMESRCIFNCPLSLSLLP